MVYLNKRILIRKKRGEKNIVIFNNMNVFYKYNIGFKKIEVNKCIIYNFMYIKFKDY